MKRSGVLLPALIAVIAIASLITWAVRPAWALEALGGLVCAALVGAIGLSIRLSRLERRLAAAPGPTAKEWATLTKRLGYGAGSVQESARRAVVRDVGALLTLHEVVEVRGETPPHAPWVALPETVLALVGYVTDLPEGALVLEIGSGLSTVWLALAADQQKRGIRIVSLEHDPEYAAATRFALARQGLADAVDLRVAPLEPVDIGGESYSWYAKATWSDLAGIDLVFVDGPPGSTSDLARYPALPELAPCLADGATLLLDDTNRSEEQAILERWTTGDFAGGRASIERVLDHATVLRFDRSVDGSRPTVAHPTP
jgi:predicted O-methyltransferase YrrM